MEKYKVPYGLNSSGELVSAEIAVKGNEHFCPFCKAKLTLKDGEERAKHFAHAHQTTSNCSLESILHKTAKRLIKGVILDNSLGKKSINLKKHCHHCGIEIIINISPNTFSNGEEEVGVSGFVCDVVGYRGDEIALAVEIFNTHKVGIIKAKNLPTHWIELHAEDVISSPYQWNPHQSKLKPNLCKNCKKQTKYINQIADKWGIDRNLYSTIKDPDSAIYIAGIETCFRCKEEIPVFWWEGVPFCESEPPLPRPKTIKYRYSKKYGGSYWANTCANCNMIQGDNFLFLSENAPLEGLPVSDST